MNALLKDSLEQSIHHWSLWVAPSAAQIKTIKGLKKEDQAKILLLHPKQPEFIMTSLLQALESGFYHSMRLAKALLTQRDQNILQLRAIRSGVSIEWTDSQPRLNKASQLSLI